MKNIQTSTFGPLMLTGDPARAFKQQFIDDPKPNLLAQKCLDDGRKMLKNFERDGFIAINLKGEVK